MEQYSYWHIDYVSCEGNERWTTARAPGDWCESEVTDRALMSGSYGDDIALIVNVYETNDEDYSLDFCD